MIQAEEYRIHFSDGTSTLMWVSVDESIVQACIDADFNADEIVGIEKTGDVSTDDYRER